MVTRLEEFLASHGGKYERIEHREGLEVADGLCP